MPIAYRSLRPAVFLDRDGVLNAVELSAGHPLPPASVARFSLLPGVPEACRLLRAAGYFLVVVTNQPDLARGLQTAENVDDMHAALTRAVQVDDIKVCPHDDADNCACRKPKPGLLMSAASEHRLDLGRSYMVGDRWRDVEAGRRAGCQTVLLYHEYDERLAEGADKVVTSLFDAAHWILSRSGSPAGANHD